MLYVSQILDIDNRPVPWCSKELTKSLTITDSETGESKTFENEKLYYHEERPILYNTIKKHYGTMPVGVNFIGLRNNTPLHKSVCLNRMDLALADLLDLEKIDQTSFAGMSAFAACDKSYMYFYHSSGIRTISNAIIKHEKHCKIDCDSKRVSILCAYDYRDWYWLTFRILDVKKFKSILAKISLLG